MITKVIHSTFIRWVRIHLLVLCAVFCFVVSAGTPLIGQNKEVERRLSDLEGAKPDHRLTALETRMDAIDWQTRGTAGGVGVLLLEAIFRIGGPRRKREP